MMRLVADENVPSASIRRLREAGHAVTAASDVLPGRPDEEVLDRARAEGAVLLTFDRDFGALVFLEGHAAPLGVVLLRFVPASPEEPAEVLLSILGAGNIELQGRFTVVERDQIRQRSLPRRSG